MIQVHNLSKSFNANKVVKSINFSIKKGEVFGLLGPNGAGKSTTINMLSTILKPDSGSVFINGNNIALEANKCKKWLGVVPQEISLYNDFTALQNLQFWGSLYNIPKKELQERMTSILKLIGLEDRKNDLIKTFSGGMKRRINIACALLHQPKVLFMDEPTVGVDPQSRNRIFEIIETLNKQGMTIVYTTHYMEEVERLCNRIAIIDAGKIVAQGTQEALQKLSNSKETLVLTFKTISEKQQNELAEQFTVKPTTNTLKITIECSVSKDLPKIVTVCNALKMTIVDVEVKKVNLETIFLDLTGKKLRD